MLPALEYTQLHTQLYTHFEMAGMGSVWVYNGVGGQVPSGRIMCLCGRRGQRWVVCKSRAVVRQCVPSCGDGQLGCEGLRSWHHALQQWIGVAVMKICRCSQTSPLLQGVLPLHVPAPAPRAHVHSPFSLTPPAQGLGEGGSLCCAH